MNLMLGAGIAAAVVIAGQMVAIKVLNDKADAAIESYGTTKAALATEKATREATEKTVRRLEGSFAGSMEGITDAIDRAIAIRAEGSARVREIVRVVPNPNCPLLNPYSDAFARELRRQRGAGGGVATDGGRAGAAGAAPEVRP